MVFLTTFLISALVIIIYNIFFKNYFIRKSPPGPIAWPILGNLLDLKLGLHPKINEWWKRYGDIYQFKLGLHRVLVISDVKCLKEAFNDPNFNSRPDTESFNIFSGGPYGVMSSSGEDWVEQRRFTLRHLRDFGFGKNSLEWTIMEEVNEILVHFKKLEGQCVDVSRKFSLAILNSLWQIIASKRYKQDDPRLLAILLQHMELADDAGKSPAIFFPAVAKLMPKISGWNKIVKVVEDSQSIFVASIEEHKKNLPVDGPRDFLDVYLQEVKMTTNPNSTFYREIGEKSVRAVMSDLFSAGGETTSATLTWTILYLCKFPHIQKKVQDEIDSVIGANRQPRLEDRPNMPYCLATMEEVLRYSCLVPIGLFHTVAADTKFHGYDIPKGTWVIPNAYGIHFDEKNFENSTEFNPQRYLTQVNGKTVLKKHEANIAFSTGKRVCLGESLARDEYWLFFTCIFQKFKMELAPQSENVGLEPKPSFMLHAPTFEVIMSDRGDN